MRLKNVALSILLLPLSSGIFAQTAENVIERKAETAPEQSFAQHPESDEIDAEIAKYFRGLKANPMADVDQRKLNQIFKKDQGSIILDNDDTISFSNMSDDEKAQMGMENHTVSSGDSIGSIAKKYSIAPEQLLKHNPELYTRPLYIGEQILVVKQESNAIPVIQKPRVHVIKRGDTLTRISRAYRVSINALRKMNKLHKGATLKIGQALVVGTTRGLPSGYRYQALFSWPVAGRITSGFGRRSNPFFGYQLQFHKGLDIGAVIGTPFSAARDGIVIFAGRMGGYGNAIFIRHENGYVSVYAHNKVLFVKKGDLVRRGQIIGQVGRTGSATGPHLHFEVRKFETPMNPIAALRMQEAVPINSTASRVP